MKSLKFPKLLSIFILAFFLTLISSPLVYGHVISETKNAFSNLNNGDNVVSIIEDGVEDLQTHFLKLLDSSYENTKNTTNFYYASEAVSDLLWPSYFKPFLKLLEDEEEFPADEIFKGIDNDNCKGHIMELLVRTRRNQTMEDIIDDPAYTWVLQMIDSWGKIPEGVLSGHINSMGDFNECVGVKARDIEIKNTLIPAEKIEKQFDGKYCTVYIADYTTAMAATNYPISEKDDKRSRSKSWAKSKSSVESLPKQSSSNEKSLNKGSVSVEELLELIQDPLGVQMIPSVGACLPSSCSKEEIQQFLVNYMDYFYTREPPEDEDEDTFMVPSSQAENNSGYPTELLWPFAFQCYEETKYNFDAADISVMVLLSVIAVISLVAGIIDFWQCDGVEKPPSRGTLMKYFMSFSLYANIKSWKSTKRPRNDIGCLHGLRFFSTSWIILSHTYYAVSFLPEWNMVDVLKVQDDWLVLTVLNSSFSVETFFVMSGMLVTYSMLNSLQRDNGKLNILKLYAKRYVRLTPTYAILVGIMATIIPYMGNGPYWIIMNNWGKICDNNWWTNILYVNNLVNTSFLCIGETWYLANDMQFYILSPFIVYPMWRWEMIGLILLAVYTILACISPALIVHVLDISPTVIPTRDILDRRSFTHLYIRPYARISTFLVGIFLGWILWKTKGKKVKLPKLLVALLWLISTVVTLVLIYAILPWFDPHNEIPKGAAMAYAGLSRFSFGVIVAWIIFACVKGYGGVIDKFLSWKVFMPLARLCYCVYLVSLHLQMILHVRFKQPARYDPYVQTNFFLAHMVMSYIVGFFLFLLFESPFMTIQKLIFDDKPKKAKKDDKVTATAVKSDNNNVPEVAATVVTEEGTIPTTAKAKEVARL